MPRPLHRNILRTSLCNNFSGNVPKLGEQKKTGKLETMCIQTIFPHFPGGGEFGGSLPQFPGCNHRFHRVIIAMIIIDCNATSQLLLSTSTSSECILRNFPEPPTPGIFSKVSPVQMGGVLRCKWEAYCGYKWEVYCGVSFLQGLEASKAQRYKWGAYCGTNWRCTASTSQTSCNSYFWAIFSYFHSRTYFGTYLVSYFRLKARNLFSSGSS